MIAIDNSSFELPPLSSIAPFYNTGPITSWSIGGTGGVSSNNAGVYTAPDGVQVGFSGSPTGASAYGVLMQSLGPVVAGATYDLSVDVGVQTAEPVNDYRLLLGVWGPGGHDLASATIFASVTNPVAVAPGIFSLASLTGTAPLDASGQLVVFLENSNAFAIPTQTAWDNVQVSVPEPSEWAMLLLGFAAVGLAAYLQRKKNSTAAFIAV